MHRTAKGEAQHDVWNWDFVQNIYGQGEPFRFLTVKDEATRFCLAIEVAQEWRRRYNQERPHSALGYQVPAAVFEGAFIWKTYHSSRSKNGGRSAPCTYHKLVPENSIYELSA